MILWLSGLRNVLRHPLITLLAVIGVALGVAVVCAVDLANQAAERSFLGAARTIAGKATHQVVGGPQGLPEDLYRDLRVAGMIPSSAPVVSGPVVFPSRGGRTLQLVGVDPFAEPPLRTFSSRFSDSSALTTLLTRPGAILLLPATARELGLRPGDRVRVQGDGVRDLAVAGYLSAPDEIGRLALASVAVADIATAQETLGMAGRLSRIDLVIPEGKGGEATLRTIASRLPPEAAVIPAGARAGALEKMTRAFRLNLTALSLLALVVGMFLIYNTMTFSVIRRRRLIGMLRALGVGRRELFVMICAEALLIGAVGTAIGLFGGNAVGAGLSRLVTRTINDLYFSVEVGSLPLLPATLVKSAALGVLATLAATIPAALEATGAPPRAVLSRSALESRHARLLPLAIAAGIILLLSGAAILSRDGWGIPGGFAGLFAVIVGYALVVPGFMVLMARLLRPAMGLLWGGIGRMAARGVAVSLSRTGVATSALVVAVAAGIGVGIMVGGFRLTVQSWLESWLQADLYVRSADNSGGRIRPPLDPGLVERLKKLPGISGYAITRRTQVEGADGFTEIMAIDLPRSTFVHYPFKQGNPEAAWSGFLNGASVVVSEPYANRHHLSVGGKVAIRTRLGLSSFPISGIVYDYGSDTGIVMMGRPAYLAHFGDPSVDGISFYAAPGVPTARVAEAIRENGEGSRIAIISNRELKEATMTIFDRTFAITGVLRVVILVVAFVGVLSALMAMQVERARELAVLRAIGLTPGQLWGVVCGETALIGLTAGLLSLPLGIIEAMILVFVVNLRSFGWTMQFHVDPVYLGEAVLLSLAAALVAGIYPSARIAGTSPALALKEDE
ncbi:ABC transporter permease [Geomonas sp. Red276]